MKQEAVLNRATNGVAAVGLSYPAWEGALQHASLVASAMVPILSAVWLALQIGAWVIRRGRK